MPVRISVPIVACNEAANLRRTLASVAWVDEIVLVDSGSTDETLDIAGEFNARIFVEPWKGYGPQVNSAIDKCTGEWILALDADEVVTPQLRSEIRALLSLQDDPDLSALELAPPEPEFDAYWIPRLNLVLGRWMRHGGIYPDPKAATLQARHGAAARRYRTACDSEMGRPQGTAQGPHAALCISQP